MFVFRQKKLEFGDAQEEGEGDDEVMNIFFSVK